MLPVRTRPVPAPAAPADERKNIDPEQVRKLAGWGLTQNDRASFVGWSPQPLAVGPVPHQPGLLIVLRLL